MIVVTGSAGFIGTNLVNRLENLGYLVVGVDPKDKNSIHPSRFTDWWSKNFRNIDFVFHLGAITDTRETDWDLLQTVNTNFSSIIWFSCFIDKVPLVYASSAATYGFGEHGYIDDHNLINQLNPVNEYAASKHEFDKFVINQKNTPPFWAGLKFFNVYGFNEKSKGAMSSMIHQGFYQAMATGKVKLFKNGEHRRDFVYVEDVVDVMIWMMQNKPESGIYNVGTGIARNFNDIVNALTIALNFKVETEYIDIIKSLKNRYQSFTQANIDKLRDIGYDKSFKPLEQGVLLTIDKLLKYENYNQPMESKA